MKYKNGEAVKFGDVIRWKCFDTDDFVTWVFTGLVKHDCVIYLGGGIDFGAAIGKRMEFAEVESQAADNDADDVGIDRVCGYVDLERVIAKMPARAACA